MRRGGGGSEKDCTLEGLVSNEMQASMLLHSLFLLAWRIRKLLEQEVPLMAAICVRIMLVAV